MQSTDNSVCKSDVSLLYTVFFIRELNHNLITFLAPTYTSSIASVDYSRIITVLYAILHVASTSQSPAARKLLIRS